ncbi:hypothetical protein I5G86_gp37 [Mycobacterium phage DarthP]|uniref:Uncharacterized protein n=1 Tax=Mycobacterium phage DarthP TaxID=2015879 RepID=A0A286MRD3_9CAUD|nr:hypothetical protein I5G86_gp37 [Mycobacterium phage DarthP]ASW31808.1 hypothetical protein SEA_DARTHP_62 [Mycobacterium phage DarthP]
MQDDSPRASVVDILTRVPLLAPAVNVGEMNRAMWQQQLAIAEATERRHDRQIRLLLAQRDVIDSQLAESTRLRDDATRTVLTAQQALDEAQP